MLSPFFSKGSIICWLKDSSDVGRTVNLHLTFMEFAPDLVSQYTYGASYADVDDKDFNRLLHTTTVSLVHTVHM